MTFKFNSPATFKQQIEDALYKKSSKAVADYKINENGDLANKGRFESIYHDIKMKYDEMGTGSVIKDIKIMRSYEDAPIGNLRDMSPENMEQMPMQAVYSNPHIDMYAIVTDEAGTEHLYYFATQEYLPNE